MNEETMMADITLADLTSLGPQYEGSEGIYQAKKEGLISALEALWLREDLRRQRCAAQLEAERARRRATKACLVNQNEGV